MTRAFLIVCMLLMLLLTVMARGDVIPTAFWMDFWGDVTLNGKPAPVGTEIKAYDPQGVWCGKFTVHTAGIYGYMHVYGDDTIQTPDVDEGASAGDIITFYINNFPTTTNPPSPQWVQDSIQKVDLSAESGVPQECKYVDRENVRITPDGYIASWLFLDPYIPTGVGSTVAVADDYLKESIPGGEKGVHKAHPKEGDKIQIKGQEYVWTRMNIQDLINMGEIPQAQVAFGNELDINCWGGNEVNNAGEYLVVYLLWKKDTTVTFTLGSDDSSESYFNDQKLTYTPVDQDWSPGNGGTGEVSVKAGKWNTLLVGVYETGGEWGISVKVDPIPDEIDNTGRAQGDVLKSDRWCDFYGTVTIDGQLAPIGTAIDAFDPQGVRCGTFIVNEALGEGEYGFMHVYGDDDTTPDFDEGAVPDDVIRFSVDSMPAETTGPDDPIWEDMEHPRHVNLALEIVPGDVNGSGAVTAFDASLVLQYVVGSISLSKSQLKAADVTGNDRVSAFDAVQILQYTVGLIIEFPVKSNPNAPIRVIQSEEELLADTLVKIERLNLSAEQRAVVNQIKQLFFQQPPTQTTLLPNYPNPFNPDTWLPYQLSEDAQVTITIYNIRGQVVRILNLGEEKAGVYLTKDRAAYWNGRDNHGQEVTSGIYFYTLQVEPLNLTINRTISKFIATRKMVIMR